MPFAADGRGGWCWMGVIIRVWDQHCIYSVQNKRGHLSPVEYYAQI